MFRQIIILQLVLGIFFSAKPQTPYKGKNWLRDTGCFHELTEAKSEQDLYFMYLKYHLCNDKDGKSKLNQIFSHAVDMDDRSVILSDISSSTQKEEWLQCIDKSNKAVFQDPEFLPYHKARILCSKELSRKEELSFYLFESFILFPEKKEISEALIKDLYGNKNYLTLLFVLRRLIRMEGTLSQSFDSKNELLWLLDDVYKQIKRNKDEEFIRIWMKNTNMPCEILGKTIPQSIDLWMYCSKFHKSSPNRFYFQNNTKVLRNKISEKYPYEMNDPFEKEWNP